MSRNSYKGLQGRNGTSVEPPGMSTGRGMSFRSQKGENKEKNGAGLAGAWCTLMMNIYCRNERMKEW